MAWAKELVRAAASACLLSATFAPAEAAQRGGGLSAYNGAWMVSSAGFCTGLGSGQVTIFNGRIIGPNGAGRVTPGGGVHTITNVNGITTVGQGRISGSVASGAFRQSDGCSGTWTAVRM